MPERFRVISKPILLIPAFILGCVSVIGIVYQQSLTTIIPSALSLFLEFAYILYALVRGRYPTQYEINQLSPFEIILVVGWVGFWLLLIFVGLFRFIRHKDIRTRHILLSAGISLILVFVWQMRLVPAPLPDNPIIRVDLNHSLGDFPSYHRGFSQGGEGQMPQAGYFEQGMELLAELNPELVRIDHLYDYYNVLSFDETGNAVYDFTQLDRIVDAIVSVGAEPFMSLSYAPQAIVTETVYRRPLDLEDWEALVYETVRYYNIERGLGIRYWEVWNEPNLRNFWIDSIEDYLELYAVSARAVKQADSTALVGGPALSSPPVHPSAYRFLEENWISALVNTVQQNNLPLDFVSWHFYSGNPHDFAKNIELHEQWLSQLNPRPQLLLTEWNYTAGDSVVMDNGQSVAYLAQTLSVFADSNLSHAFYFEPIDGGDDWISRWGLIRADGTPKASYYAYTLFDRLTGERLATESNHPYIGAMASVEEGRVAILVWNNTNAVETVTLHIEGATPSEQTINLYGVDEQYGNPYYADGTTETFIKSVEVTLDDLQLEMPAYSIRLIAWDER